MVKKQILFSKSMVWICWCLLLIGNTNTVVALTLQKRVVTGVVTDNLGEAIIGANILEKGTSNGTITDYEGKFALEVLGDKPILRITYIGFNSQEIVVGKRNSLVIKLQEDSQALNEVVVVGYGVQRKVTTTGAVSKLEGEEISKMTVVNPIKALQGLSPGITIIDRGGAPGADDPDIYLRGVGTTGETKPLVLIDGVEMSLSQVPASDIENISVLKDAASASIYGSRAAHGVILVTTKRGKEGRFNISYDGSVGFQDRATKAEQVSAREYMEMVNEALEHAGQHIKYQPEDITDVENGLNPYKYAYYNWPDEVYKSNYITEHSLNVNGGTEKARFLLSFNYLNQPGLTSNTGYKRYNYRANTDLNINKYLKIGSSLTYSHTNRLWPQGLGDAQYLVWGMQPTSPKYYENGGYALYKGTSNALACTDLEVVGEDRYNRDAVYGQVKVDFEPIKDLVFTGTASLKGVWDRRKIHYKNHKFYNEIGELKAQRNSVNSVADERNNNYQLTLRFLANYKKKIAEVHDIAVLYGMEQTSYRNYWSKAERKNLISDKLPDVSLGSADSQFAEGKPTLWGINSFFGRLNYGFKDKYLFEANLRADGSSRFAKGHKWGVFPSFSAAWRLSEEGFIKRFGWIDNLKLRASWGQTGNERIGEFKYLTQYGTENVVLDGALVTAVRQKQMSNPNITWETVEQTNIGLDFGFWNNQFFGEIDWYTKDTKDILLNLAIPYFIGLDAPEQNVGIVRNTGIETMLGFRKTIKDFRFSISANMAYNHNEWIDRAGDDRHISGWSIEAKGSPLNAFYIYEADGLIANDTELEEYKSKFKSDPRGMNILKAGDVKFVDVNKDGTINPEDRKIYRPNIPSFNYGLNLMAEYKGFDLTVLFQGAAGANLILEKEFVEGPNYEVFTGVHWRDRWTDDNQRGDASMPRLQAANNRNTSTYNSFFLKNNSYLRLKNLQLGYTFPAKWTEKIKVNRLRVYVSGSNLLTFSSLPQGMDPETSNGVLNDYPAIKIMNFGVNINF